MQYVQEPAEREIFLVVLYIKSRGKRLEDKNLGAFSSRSRAIDYICRITGSDVPNGWNHMLYEEGDEFAALNIEPHILDAPEGGYPDFSFGDRNDIVQYMRKWRRSDDE